jgi:hypothetical protein
MSCNWTQTLWTFRTQNSASNGGFAPAMLWTCLLTMTDRWRKVWSRAVWRPFDSEMIVYYRGQEVGADYLGQSIYENVSDFRDHIGMNTRGHGSYFSDMVRGAVAEARKNLADRPRLRKVA